MHSALINGNFVIVVVDKAEGVFLDDPNKVGENACK